MKVPEVAANTRQQWTSVQTPWHLHPFYWRGPPTLHSCLDPIFIIVVFNRFSVKSWSQTPLIVSRSVGDCQMRRPSWVCWRWSRPGHPAGSSPTIQSIRESENQTHPHTLSWWVLSLTWKFNIPLIFSSSFPARLSWKDLQKRPKKKCKNPLLLTLCHFNATLTYGRNP